MRSRYSDGWFAVDAAAVKIVADEVAARVVGQCAGPGAAMSELAQHRQAVGGITAANDTLLKGANLGISIGYSATRLTISSAATPTPSTRLDRPFPTCDGCLDRSEDIVQRIHCRALIVSGIHKASS